MQGSFIFPWLDNEVGIAETLERRMNTRVCYCNFIEFQVDLK